MIIQEKFWSKVYVGDSCWEWSGGHSKNGYGLFNGPTKTLSCHRLSYSLWFDKDIDSLNCILHKCDNRGCVRPDHLFEGTYKDNNKDRALKNRSVFTGFLTEADIISIKELYLTKTYSQTKLAKMFSCDQSHISRILNNEARIKKWL